MPKQFGEEISSEKAYGEARSATAYMSTSTLKGIEAQSKQYGDEQNRAVRDELHSRSTG